MNWTATVIGEPNITDKISKIKLPKNTQLKAIGNNKYKIESDLLSIATTHAEANEIADSIKDMINGYCNLFYGFSPLENVSSTYAQSGRGRNSGCAVLRCQITMIVSSQLDDAQRDEDLIKFFELSFSNSAVKAVFTILGRPSNDWQNPYKILEIIKDDLSLIENGLEKICKVSKTQLQLFGLAANHPDASGELARHAIMDGKINSVPMLLDEGKFLVKRIALLWLKYKWETNHER